MPPDISHIQGRLKQAILHHQWDRASAIIAEYRDGVHRLKQSGKAMSEGSARRYESENRRLVHLLQAAMTRAQDDIDDLTRTIHRLDRGKAMLVSDTSSKG